MERKNGLGQEGDKEGKREGWRVVVKLNDCFVRIIIDDSGSVNY